jgi:hypothetical protein
VKTSERERERRERERGGERSYGFLHAIKEECDDVLADDNVQLLHVLPGDVVWSVCFVCKKE